MKLFVIFVFVVLFQVVTLAQQSINSAGGDATGIGGSIAYSIGQVVYTTNNSNSGSVAQGVQHAYEIFAVNTTESGLNISLTAFPNPTRDNVTIQIIDYNNERLSYQLFDTHGRRLINGQINSHQTQINTVSLPAGAYYIFVFNQDNLKLQTYKLIKK
jgi:hypothetical protein